MGIFDMVDTLYKDRDIITGAEAGENDDVWGDEADNNVGGGEVDSGGDEWGDSSDDDFSFDDDGDSDFDFDNPFGDDESDDDFGEASTTKNEVDPNKAIGDSKLADILRTNIAENFSKLVEVSRTNLEIMSDNFRNDDIDFIISRYEETFNHLNEYIHRLNKDTDDYSRLETFIMFRSQFRSMVDEYLKVTDSIESMNMSAY